MSFTKVIKYLKKKFCYTFTNELKYLKSSLQKKKLVFGMKKIVLTPGVIDYIFFSVEKKNVFFRVRVKNKIKVAGFVTRRTCFRFLS